MLGACYKYAMSQALRSVLANVKRLLPVALLAAGLILFFAFDLHHVISFDLLRSHHATLQAWVSDHHVLAPLAFMVVYATAVAFSLPVGLVLTVSCGFLFGTLLATCVVTVAGTLGAVAIFLAARSAFGPLLRGRVQGALARFEAEFRRDAFSYLLVLRLVPLFPFWLVNLAPAFTGVKLVTYAAATFIGIIPATLVFASVGSGLGAVFEAGGSPNLAMIFEPHILGPIIGLALLALGPVVYKRLRRQPD
jgi:uncharacterized membrane protein YdjX (TVP38/TMEM64 family)